MIRSNHRVTLPDIRSLVDLIYKMETDDLISETPSILKIIRYILLLGIPFLIHPVLVIPVFIIDRIIEEKVNEHQYEKLNRDLEEELEDIKKRCKKVDDELDDLMDDGSEMIQKKRRKLEEEQRNLNEFKTVLKRNLEKVRSYYERITHYREKQKELENYWECENMLEEIDNHYLELLETYTGNIISEYIDKIVREDIEINKEKSRFLPKYNTMSLLEMRDNLNNDYNIIKDSIIRENLGDDIYHHVRKAGEGLARDAEGVSKYIPSVADIHHTSHEAVRKVAHADKVVSHTIDTTSGVVTGDIKTQEMNKVRSQIVSGTKLSSLFKLALAGGTLIAINNFVGILAVAVWVWRRNWLKQNEKEKLLHELHAEMEIVNEKIKDASGDGDKKKKYQYLRLRREIQRTIDKINYGQSIVRPDVTKISGAED